MPDAPMPDAPLSERSGRDAHPGHQALAHATRVLDQRPRKDDIELTLATQCLARFREELLAAQRAGPASDQKRDCLSRLNAIIAVVMAMHFPIGNPPWDEFEKTQGWLRALVEEAER